MLAHTKVVIATPDGDVSTILHLDGRVLELLCSWGTVRRPSENAEPPVRAVLHLGFDLALEERIVVQFSISCEGGGQM